MKMDEFEKKVESALKEYSGGKSEIRISRIRKNNGILLTGVSVLNKDTVITPTIYIDEYLKLYNKGMAFGAIMNEIIDMLEKHQVKEEVDIRFFSEWERAQKHIAFRLINSAKNKELLSDIPHIDLMDMSIVFYYFMEGANFGNASILIYNEHLKCWGIGAEELYSRAKLNTPVLLPACIKDMEELICTVIRNDLMHRAEKDKSVFGEGLIRETADELLDQIIGERREMCMYVLTNTNNYHGAGCMIYPELLQKFSQKLGANMFILPSSIHEVILLPDIGIEDAAELRRMVSEVNDTQLTPEEVLSDSVYYYDWEKDEISIAQPAVKADMRACPLAAAE